MVYIRGDGGGGKGVVACFSTCVLKILGCAAEFIISFSSVMQHA